MISFQLRRKLPSRKKLAASKEKEQNEIRLYLDKIGTEIVPHQESSGGIIV